MAHGHPDWGVSGPKSTLYTLQDMAELAVRLGSIVSFDRRGDVVWYDDFESTTLKWASVLAGAGAAVARSTAMAYHGDASLAITAGSDGSHYANAYRNLELPVLSKVGVELAFAHEGNTSAVSLLLQVHTGGTALWPAVAYSHVAKTLSYYAATGATVILATGVSLPYSAQIWNHLKLVIDIDDAEYQRLIVGSTTYDMTGIACLTSASVAVPLLQTQIIHEGVAGSNPVCYVEDVIFTQNEP